MIIVDKLSTSTIMNNPTKAQLVSCHLLEVGKDDRPLWTWSYPHLENKLRLLCLKKCHALLKSRKLANAGNDGSTVFKYFHLRQHWYYILLSGTLPSHTEDNSSGDRPIRFSEVAELGVIIAASDFNPERYQNVGKVFLRTYLHTEDPSAILQQFLSLVVDGTCIGQRKKTFTLSEYDDINPHSDHQIKEIITRFGLETILIYTALVRKTRIVVYHYDIDELMQVILSFPAFFTDSKNMWNFIYPWVDANEDEMSYLKENLYYVMGCLQAEIENKLDIYDVFVNIPAAEIIVAPHAKDALAMNKTHKELALFMVQLAANKEITEDEVVAEVSRKSLELFTKNPDVPKSLSKR